MGPVTVTGIDCYHSLHVVDVTETPSSYAEFESHSCISDIAVAGDTLVATSGDKGLQVFDARDPANLALVSEFVYPPGFTGAGAIALNEDVAYLVSGNAGWGESMTLRVLDRTHPDAPMVVGQPVELPSDNGIMGLYVRGNRLDVVDIHRPMRSLDISQPANPRLITDAGIQSPEACWPVPALAGNALYTWQGVMPACSL